MKRWLLAAAATLSMSCGPTCVARGTRIQTPRGQRRVEELAVGDEVIAVNPHTGEHEVTTITEIRFSDREHGALTIGNTTLHVTSDHPLFDPQTREFHPAGDWLLGLRTQLLAFDGDRPEVTAMKPFAGIETVFDLTVASSLHTFVAEGIVVHNKTPLRCTLADGGFLLEGEKCTCSDGTEGDLGCNNGKEVCDCPK
ncbi:MAG: hypothetical protein DI536_09940 [Archangium gephyra]|uniref:Hedgehog/Intein (Hint) domain-containing protein n=1 Tax=Archangium gephyra TaxID=48 RepID=A0A2W5TSR0_9BACT|nr:MAG: hypothetical protein DI536_09940 [Archangium gephyra]